MIRLFILCEGQTEEMFVNELLVDYFYNKEIIATPIVLTTKRTALKKFKGGVSSYSKIKNEIEILCKSDKTAFITTMLDYYALPLDVPGRKEAEGQDIYEKVLYIEEQMYRDISLENFIPNIILHEFEGLLFSKPRYFLNCDPDERKIQRLIKIREENETPEHIDDGEDTAPSKRIKGIYPNYDKILDGVSIAKDIGIHTILEECLHFSGWVDRLCEVGR